MNTVTHEDALNHLKVYASDSLMEELTEKNASKGPVVNVAYTDYGGDFFDKVLIAYFLAKHPENIITEPTSYYGKNAFIFGDLVPAFVEETERYPLGFEDLEEFFCQMEDEEYTTAIDSILKDDLNKYTFDPEAVREWFDENFRGWHNITTQGVDYCSSELFDTMEKDGVITPSND